MAKSSDIPAAGMSGYGSTASPDGGLVELVTPVSAPNGASNGAREGASMPSAGPRKLVRPVVPGRSRSSRGLHEESPILAHQSMTHSAAPESSHAETFYFQKQIQTQTPLVVVLEDGEKIEGCIEWYDRYSIKMRSSVRTLIYKSAIKYIYKLGEHGH